MEQQAYTNNENGLQNKTSYAGYFKTIIIICLLAAPLVYLYIVSEPKPAITEGSPTQSVQQGNIAALENEVTKNPSFDNLINLSMAYINNQMPEKSIPYLQKAIQLNPNSAIAFNNLGVAYILTQQYQQGIDACNKAIQIDPSFQLAKNNLQWGIDEQTKLLAIVPNYENTPDANRDATFYIDYGMVYYKIGNYDKSIEVWKKGLEKDSKNSIILNNIGSALMMMNKIDEAIVVFKKVIEIEPNNELAKNNLTWALGVKSGLTTN